MNNKSRDVVVLDLVLADQLLLSYRRGLLTRQQTRKKLLDDANVGEKHVDMALDEVAALELEEAERQFDSSDGPGLQLTYEQCPQCKGKRTVLLDQSSCTQCPHCQGQGVVLVAVA